jgi:exosortase/archaeosortase family protein
MNMLISENIRKRLLRLQPFQGVIVFVVVMFTANWFWKFFVHDGIYDPIVTLWGINITAPFLSAQHEIVRVAGLVFELFNIPFALSHGSVFVFDNHQSTEIAWGCTGLKQAFIFTCIILFSRGLWKNKWWYILVGLAVVHATNVLRISIVGAVLNYNPDSFDLVHTYFFKYVFYFIIFLMWVLWEEVFCNKRVAKKTQEGIGLMDYV